MHVYKRKKNNKNCGVGKEGVGTVSGSRCPLRPSSVRQTACHCELGEWDTVVYRAYNLLGRNNIEIVIKKLLTYRSSSKCHRLNFAWCLEHIMWMSRFFESNHLIGSEVRRNVASSYKVANFNWCIHLWKFT